MSCVALSSSLLVACRADDDRGRPHSMIRHQAHAALAFAIAAAIAPAAGATLDEPVVFNVPSQPIPAALIEFSKQADVQVMGASESYRHLRSTEVDGVMSGDDALRLML